MESLLKKTNKKTFSLLHTRSKNNWSILFRKGFNQFDLFTQIKFWIFCFWKVSGAPPITPSSYNVMIYSSFLTKKNSYFLFVKKPFKILRHELWNTFWHLCLPGPEIYHGNFLKEKVCVTLKYFLLTKISSDYYLDFSPKRRLGHKELPIYYMTTIWAKQGGIPSHHVNKICQFES